MANQPQDIIGGNPFTGRTLVLFKRSKTDATSQHVKLLKDKTGLNVASASDFKDDVPTASDLRASVLYLPEISAAVLPYQQDATIATALESDDSGLVMLTERERVVYAAVVDDFQNPRRPGSAGYVNPSQPVSLDYVRGFQHGVTAMAERLTGAATDDGGPAAGADSLQATWGIQAVRAQTSRATGEGIKVAVLDTGIDDTNPDFQNRTIVKQSFVPGESALDGNGHGTHCIGTALGSYLANGTKRYGVAGAADIYAGKVLNNAGSGADGDILAGINWAIGQGCQVISMSLGGRVSPGQGYSQIFENVEQRAMAASTLIIAAAGNDSQRPNYIAPVGHPANCPSVMAIGAVDESLGIAYFSNGTINYGGGEVNLAGPGVEVFSTWLMPMRYNTISGTSMATPHVAGVAALYAQQDNKARGQNLWDVLMSTARAINLPPRDVGNGLVQAPE